MYARDLMLWLHSRLAEPNAFEQTKQRFEKLRGCRLLPQGRENAGVRLSNEHISSAVLGFVHRLPGFAGHASLILGQLRPVGGTQASFGGKPTLLDVMASFVGSEQASGDILRLTLSVERDFGDYEYSATLHFLQEGKGRVVSFVSKYAETLLQSGAEDDYDHEKLHKIAATEIALGSDFFRELAQTVALSRHFDRPFETDWRDYESEEELAEFHKRLGARRSSNFLSLRVEAQVTWPKEPTRIEFGGHYLVLFPQTKDHSHSISIDLAHERLSVDEARSLMNRLLSVMAWCNDQPASLHEGWSGNPVPTPVPKKNLAFMTTPQWHFYRTPPGDEQLKKCLAYYRDGLNAFSVGLASHAFLSFYKIIESKFGQNKWPAIRWMNAEVSLIEHFILKNFTDYESDRAATGLDHGHYIYKRCRVATAHASTDAPSDTDGAKEIRRLLNAARFVQFLARRFIKQEFKFSDTYLSDDVE
jgi:hypothetical protein